MSNKLLSKTSSLPCWLQKSQGWPLVLSFAPTLWLHTSATLLILSFSECLVDNSGANDGVHKAWAKDPGPQRSSLGRALLGKSPRSRHLSL